MGKGVMLRDGCPERRRGAEERCWALGNGIDLRDRGAGPGVSQPGAKGEQAWALKVKVSEHMGDAWIQSKRLALKPKGDRGEV